MSKDKNRIYEGNLHRSFVLRVLAPPFIALLLLSLIGLWQLDVLLRHQAVEGLRQSAVTTADALDREFALRETILKRTAEEIMIIKNEYQDSRKKLDADRAACREHLRTSRDFRDSPGKVCESFAVGLTANGASFAALEDEYVRVGEESIAQQKQRVNERLSAFKQFFPETLALIISDNNGEVVSSALSGAFKGSTEAFQTESTSALKAPVYGRQMEVEGLRLSVFAFPVANGTALAAYDIYSPNFIQPTWSRAPINRNQMIVVILDNENKLAYPNIKSSKQFREASHQLRNEGLAEIILDDVDHTVVAAKAGTSQWLVTVASPTAAVLAPLRDAQLVGLIFVGLFMVAFTWVGSFFIQRTLSNIVRLVSGAMVFGTGRLDYKIQLDHADSEFVRLGDTMNLMAERIAAAEQLIDEKNREFISVATHEIRAPLSAIIGHLSLLQEMYGTKLNKQANSLLNQANYSSVRLRDLVNDMLNVARLESGRNEFTLAPLDIKPVIKDVVDVMSVVAKISNARLSYDDKYAEHVSADEGRLRIIVNNFVSNALKYNKPGGTVEIYHEKQGDQLVTAIKDNGLGIPENQKAHMFEKFFRVEHEDRKTVTGTGLGMYIVKMYIEQMNGRLWFQSEHGKGTTFYFSLPIVRVGLRHKIAARLRRTSRKTKKPHSKILRRKTKS